MAYGSYYSAQQSTSGNRVVLPYVSLTVQSAEMLLTAQPILRFSQIVTEKTELGVQSGDGINFTKYAALSGSSTLTEGIAMTTAALSTSQISVTVAEHGKGVSVSELRLRTSFTNIMSDTAQLLGRHLAKDYDGRVRDVLCASANVAYANDKATRAVLTASDMFSVDLVQEAVESLAINKAPKFFGGDAYLCFIHPHQARGLKNDPNWQHARAYSAPVQLLTGEIGRIDDVRFIETTQCLKVATTGDIYADGTDTTVDSGVYNTTVDTYKAVIVGDHVVGHAMALPPEMRDNGTLDFDRERSLAWYGIDGLGLIESGHVYILESA